MKLSKANSNVDGIATAKSNIVVAKFKFEGFSIEEVLKTSQELYKTVVAQIGEELESQIMQVKTMLSFTECQLLG